MDIHYKIVEVIPNEHSIIVRYFTDFMTEEMLNSMPDSPERREDGSPMRCRTDYNINLPVPAPAGEDLNKFILERAPLHWFDIHQSIQDGVF